MSDYSKVYAPPLDPVGGFYASLVNLSTKVSVLQDKLDDILGLRESLAVWQRNATVDAQYRSQVKEKIDAFMKEHSHKECAEFLASRLAAYYTRRISLAKALEKVGNMKPTATTLKLELKADNPEDPAKTALFDCDIMKDMRKSLSELSDIHTLLQNILKGTVKADSVENKSLCDEQYLTSLAKDLSVSSSGLFVNAYSRLDAMMKEIESAERQVRKLEERAASYSRSAEAEEAKQKLKKLEEEYDSFLQTPEAREAVEKLEAMKDHRKKNLCPGNKAYKNMTDEIRKQEEVVLSFTSTPEANAVQNQIKELRKRIFALRNSPEAKAAHMLASKRSDAVDVLKKRMVTEAEQFCRMRNEILKAVADASSEIAFRCRNLPTQVRDVFRTNPPKFAEEIVSLNSQLAYRK